jgi:Asp-tRNA(Asn)/Glu-tRNA(Gln) amidotransferase A subunit family amidase
MLPTTLTDAAAALRDGSVTAVELTEAAIRRANALDGKLGAYLARFDETALAAASAADDKLRAGEDSGPLLGIPFGVKDILAAREGPTTAQSLVMDPAWGEGRDAVTVSRIRAAGAVITGKLTTMEYACGMPDPDKPFPLPRNPWNLETWPGGSSSGTGAAVSAGLVWAGFGTDTGGSIRIPAAFCGVSGIMPTFGRVPKSGCVPLGYSLDHIGPLARSARDCAAVLGVIAGPDPTDPTSTDRPVPDFMAALTGSVEGLRIGVDRVHHMPSNGDPAVAERFESALAVLEAGGATLVEVSLPHYPEGVAATMVTLAGEALAYHMPDLQNRWADYTPGFRMIAAQGALSTAADYVQAQRVRRVLQGELAALLSNLDALIMPTASTAAPRYDDVLQGGAVGTMMSLVHTPYWDGLGNPVLAVPIGGNQHGLPLSMQIAGRPFDESTILQIGDAYQQQTEWHLQIPPLSASAGGLDGREQV